MARPKKKLQKSDINRNTSVELSHTIKKIKENERKYTIILVIIFMFVIVGIGYKILSIDNTTILSDVKNYSKGNSYFSSSSQKITLTNDNVLEDKDGLSLKKNVIQITNNTNLDKYYKIYFVSDDKELCNCGNKIFDMKKIRFSLDGSTVLSLGEKNLFAEGVIGKWEKRNITYNIWIDKNVNLDEEYHLHGYFIVEED